MAIKETYINNNLVLEISNGDLTSLDEIRQKWSFKNYQSMFRYIASVMTLAEDHFLVIKEKGDYQQYEPASELLYLEALKNNE